MNANRTGYIVGKYLLPICPVRKEVPTTQEADFSIYIARPDKLINVTLFRDRLSRGLDIIKIGEAIHSTEVDDKLFWSIR
ncbi:hypothetical protein WT24_31765 [Burkholderia sp. MSMB1078WGS]|nr:hypothetical protein WT24_31765 [Burkholderia sp. MSMB1078WGS]